MRVNPPRIHPRSSGRNPKLFVFKRLAAVKLDPCQRRVTAGAMQSDELPTSEPDEAHQASGMFC